LYQPRSYREGMNSDRFRFFPSVLLESDLLIGVPHADYHPEMAPMALKEQSRLHRLLTAHAARHKSFLDSLEPLELSAGGPDLPGEIATMYRCGLQTGTGPMSSVAGLFAEAVAAVLSVAFSPGEIVVENGGDLYIRNREELVTVIHAGNSPLSDRMGLAVPPGTWGICTSSGTLGHSFSRGRADAVTVACRSAPLADAWATSLANEVRGAGDIEPLLKKVKGIPEIEAVVVIAGDRIGIRGSLEAKLLS
jgi:ApbE superfamily uncharacterized protein (UPF0280 family)